MTEQVTAALAIPDKQEQPPTSSSPFPVSDVTLTILRNFGHINNELLLVKGHRQHVVLRSKAILAVAELFDAWPETTAIRDMTSFVTVLAAFQRSVIHFEGEAMHIKDGANAQQHFVHPYVDSHTVATVEPKSFPHDPPAVEFTLSEAALRQMKKFAALLDLSVVTVTLDQGQVRVHVSDPHKSPLHQFVLDIAPDDTTVHDPQFSKTIRFMAEHFMFLLDGTYRVSLAAWPYGFFTHATVPIVYYVASKREAA